MTTGNMVWRSGVRLIAAAFVAVGIALLWTTSVHAQQGAILSPTAGATLSGMVFVRGTATHPDFRKWQLDIVVNGDRDPAHFLALSETPAEAPTLMTVLDSREFPNGAHLLRLRVVHTSQNYDEYYVPIVIDNNRRSTSALSAAARAAPIALVQATPEPTMAAPATPTPAPVPTPIIRTDVPDGERWIEVDLSDQWLVAYQGDQPVFEGAVSTGKEGWHTLPGDFRVYLKYVETRMRGEDYDTPDVPWTMYYSGDFAIHGAYWHNNFGTPVSHGCVNLPVDQARALFDWAPMGTRVVVRQ